MLPPSRPLTDGVVRLRRSTALDEAAIDRGLQDPDVVRWFGRSTQSAAETLHLNERRWEDGSGPTFSIVRDDDRCVGLVWLNLGGPARATVGYWLLPEARGKGLATRSVRLIGEWAFDELGILRLAILAEPENAASCAVAVRSGYRFEGVLRSYEVVDDRRVDFAVYSLLRGESEAAW